MAIVSDKGIFITVKEFLSCHTLYGQTGTFEDVCGSLRWESPQRVKKGVDSKLTNKQVKRLHTGGWQLQATHVMPINTNMHIDLVKLKYCCLFHVQWKREGEPGEVVFIDSDGNVALNQKAYAMTFSHYMEMKKFTPVEGELPAVCKVGLVTQNFTILGWKDHGASVNRKYHIEVFTKELNGVNADPKHETKLAWIEFPESTSVPVRIVWKTRVENKIELVSPKQAIRNGKKLAFPNWNKK